MFIDYVPLMLINMAAGLFLLACYVYKGAGEAQDNKKWASGFLIAALVALICGFHMTFTWPLPGSYNVAFGEMSVLLGALFLGASLSLANNWNLLPLGIYAIFAGMAAIVTGARIIGLGMTREPVISGIGFILSGLSGVLILPAIWLGRNRVLRWLIVLLLVAAAFIWARTGYKACWSHLSDLSKWAPATMR